MKEKDTGNSGGGEKSSNSDRSKNKNNLKICETALFTWNFLLKVSWDFFYLRKVFADMVKEYFLAKKPKCKPSMSLFKQILLHI